MDFSAWKLMMPGTLFVSYSHKDEDYKNYVVSHLGVAEKQGLLKTWDDRRIKGGGDWRKEIETALAEAKVAVLLVSRHSLTSDFILNEEVATMLRRRDQEGLRIYPIVIRACDWEAVDWLKAMNLRPFDGKPLARFTLGQRDEVMAGISKEIRGFLDDDAEIAATPVELPPSPVDDAIDRLAQRTEALSAELGTTEGAINGMFEFLAEQNPPIEQLDTKLRELAKRHLSLKDQFHKHSSEDPNVTVLYQMAADRFEEGDYDRVVDLLTETIRINQTEIDERIDALDQQFLNIASIYNFLGDLEFLRHNYGKAAEYFSEAASQVPHSDAGKRLQYLKKQASVKYDQGDEFGDNLALEKSIEVYQSILENFSWRDMLLERAEIETSLGKVLRRLGDRENGRDKLDKAVTAFQDALKVRTRASYPYEWAETQSNLGQAYRAISLRESNNENLELAIKCYKNSLEIWSQESTPIEWAKAQNNLGYALWRLAERENGIAKLKQSKASFELALEVRIRQEHPLDWAETQRNLGIVFTMLGERENCIAKLERANEIFLRALEVNTRQRVPLKWAATQNHLGIVLRVLGEREKGTKRLQQAVSVLQDALKERTRERARIQWAHTNESLGLTYLAIARKTKCVSMLVEGIETIKIALQVYKAGSVAYDIQTAKLNLGDAEALLKKIKAERKSEGYPE